MEKRELAVNMMQHLGVMHPCIDALKKGGLWQSESLMPGFGGILFEASQDVREKAAELEKNGDALVWHVIRGRYNIGGDLMDLDTYLLVTNSDADSGELPLERCKEGDFAFSYVYNRTAPDCSEYGDVLIKMENGGIVRVY